MIKLNTIGKITNGEYKDWEVVIEELNGAYIVAYWSKAINKGFDDYYEDYEILEQGLSFDIAWTDQPYTSKAPNAEVLKKIEDFLSNIKSKP